jgi:1-pyrroline-5-carboxylate dehydrogenase
VASSSWHLDCIAELKYLAPALVGNVCVWKPSPLSVYANYLVHRIFTEAGVPAGVIQFLPCTNEPSKVSSFVSTAISSPHFAALHFTGSTDVFKKLWKEVASNMDNYKGYPRLVGETGGKNFHLIHSSVLDIEDGVQNAVMQSVRSGFEYQGKSML